MANEVKQLNASKMESERRRKQTDQGLQEASIKLAESERSRQDLQEKIAKLTVSIQWASIIGLLKQMTLNTVGLLHMSNWFVKSVV